MSARIKSAQNLIKQGDSYIANANALHKRATQQIAQAKVLKGEAEKLEKLAPKAIPVQKLTAQQYQAGLQSYKADIDKFKQHADIYNAHLQDFQQLVGECHANEAAYQAIAQQYQLHVEQFHIPMPNIQPPHICGELQMNQGQAASLSWMLRSDQAKVANAEFALQQEESKLAATEAMAPVIAKRLVNNSDRAKAEQGLAEEFGRLKQEYDLLSVEGKTLAANKGIPVDKLVRTSVSAKIR
jgi:hypothetical protein